MPNIFKPFIWLSNFIQNNFKTAIFLLIIYLIFFNNAEVIEKPNLYKIHLNTQIMEATSFLDEVKKADEEHIKGVLLLVDSPGGAVAPSVEMSMAIHALSQKKPVVAYAMGTMASGSYYASIWANKIIANPGSTLGSIGVKFDGYNVEKLAQKLGIEFQGAQAGEYKNAGTYTREWTKSEKQELENLIKDTYDMFVNDVAMARHLDVNNSKNFAEGRVFSAKRSKELGLVDELGSYNNAVEILKQVTNVDDAIFNEPDEFDKIMEKLGEKTSKVLMSFYPKLMSMI